MVWPRSCLCHESAGIVIAKASAVSPSTTLRHHAESLRPDTEPEVRRRPAQHIAKLAWHRRIVDVGSTVADEARMAPILIERRQKLV
jgi:hypothetical protein